MSEISSENQFEDFSSTGIREKQTINKNMIIIGTISFFVILLLIIIIIIIVEKTNKSKTHLGDIVCFYDINKINTDIEILGKEYNKSSDFDIFIEGEKIKYSKTHKFNETKIYNITFKLYDNINMDSMFKNISSLISVELIANKEIYISSMKNTFEDCTNLESFKLDGFAINKIKSFEKLFYKTSMKSINLDNFDSSNVEDISYMFAFSQIENLDLSKLNTKSVKNMAYLFYECSSLYSINLTIDTNQVVNMSNLFAGCVSLSSLDLSYLDTSNVKDMSSMFYNCISLLNLKLSKLNTKSVLDMSHMFDYCSSLNSLDLSNFDTSKVKICLLCLNIVVL